MKATEEIKSRIDIVEVVSETVKLRRTGNSHTGFCPFHDNKNTPAFVVWPDTGSWKCFGACNDGGDVFSFLMKREGWEFMEALQYLALRAGIELEKSSPRQENEKKEQQRLYGLLNDITGYYHTNLIESDNAKAARTLLLQRGLSQEIWVKFEIGYANDSWNDIRSYCLERGYSDEDLITIGLLVKKDTGKVYDRFRDRIMLPICLPKGQTIGFGARVVNSTDQPKFINSPQTKYFDKGSLLYGIDKAYMGIRENRTAVLVEGYMDVIAAHQAGFTNVVSAMGTALTEKQLRLVKRYAPRVVLALDPDVAGDRATLRSLSVARQNLDRESNPVFDPRGLLRDEGHLELDIRVVTLPNEMDPDELIELDSDSWSELVDGAQPIVDYVIDVFTTGRNLSDSKVKAEIIDDVVPIISDVSHPTERADYKQKLARILKVDERVIQFNKIGLYKPNSSNKDSLHNDNVTNNNMYDELEQYVLASLIKMPQVLSKIDRAFREVDADILSARDFDVPDYQRIFEIVKKSVSQADVEPEIYIKNQTCLEMKEQLQRLYDIGQEWIFLDERRIKDFVHAAIRLRARNLRIWLTDLQHLESVAKDQKDLHQAKNYQGIIIKYTQSMRGLQKLLRNYSDPLILSEQ
tara:strand:+ start:1101 stop:3005 length:1905 start_codon:yes stop_codon:yes gene_type:complete